MQFDPGVEQRRFAAGVAVGENSKTAARESTVDDGQSTIFSQRYSICEYVCVKEIAWIKTIEPESARGELKELYDQVTTPHGTVDNVMKAHSLRPRTMRGHLVLYKSVLHDDSITLPLWYLECIASYTSMINHCDYSQFMTLC